MKTVNRDNPIIVPVELRLRDYLRIILTEIHASNTQKYYLFCTRKKREREISRDVGKGNASGSKKRDKMLGHGSHSSTDFKYCK